MPRRPPPPDEIDHGLEALLAYDGRIEYLPEGYFGRADTRRARHRAENLGYPTGAHPMTTYRVQSFDALHQEMLAVARGEREAPPHAAEPSVHSAEMIVRVLTPENRELLATIRERRPASVSQLAEWTGRAGPNLGRTLDKLERVGLIEYEREGRRKAPRAVNRAFVLTIDPFSTSGDRIELCDRAPAEDSRPSVSATGDAAGAAAGGRHAGRPGAARSRTGRAGRAS